MTENQEQWKTIQRHKKVRFLAEKHPYKIMYGGRDGIKSWSFARQLLIDAAERPVRTLCCRETMLSLDDSVHQLLKDQIELLGLERHFRVLKNEIQGTRVDSKFSYTGLRNNTRQIKSFEGYDRAWVEEAATVTKESWMILLPTIRKKGSEIWVSFNPELETDYTYFYWVLNPPPGAVVVKTGYEDNIWLSPESIAKIEHLKVSDPETFEHVYAGSCITNVKGAILKNEFKKVDEEQRIRQVPYDPSKPVSTYWDIGDRYTAFWFVQQFPLELRVIDFEFGEGESIEEYMRLLHIDKFGRTRPYKSDTQWLPWDGKSVQLGTGRSIEEQMRAAGYRVRIVPRIGVTQKINALKSVFPQIWFDKENCSDGLQMLRRWKRAPTTKEGVIKIKPLHDINSHPADALTQMGVVTKGLKEEEIPDPKDPVYAHQENMNGFAVGGNSEFFDTSDQGWTI